MVVKIPAVSTGDATLAVKNTIIWPNGRLWRFLLRRRRRGGEKPHPCPAIARCASPPPARPQRAETHSHRRPSTENFWSAYGKRVWANLWSQRLLRCQQAAFNLGRAFIQRPIHFDPGQCSSHIFPLLLLHLGSSNTVQSSDRS